jgi:hypothetical protein
MWRSLVVKVNCWSPGRHPLCRIFFLLSQFRVQYYKRYSEVNNCVCAVNNLYKKKWDLFSQWAILLKGDFICFLCCHQIKEQNNNEVKYTHIELTSKQKTLSSHLKFVHFISLRHNIISFDFEVLTLVQEGTVCPLVL